MRDISSGDIVDMGFTFSVSVRVPPFPFVCLLYLYLVRADLADDRDEK